MGLDHSPEAARGALMGLYQWADGRCGAPELIEVSIKSPRGKWHASHFSVDTLLDPETLKGLAYWSSEGREIYMGCVGLTGRPEPTKHQPHPRGGAALRGRAGALWIDVDCQAPGREGTDYFARVEDAVEIIDLALGADLADCALVIGSGWGVQYWIPLAEPVEGSEASRVVRALIGWLTEITAKKIDRVWDVTRVMRMPGTTNWRAGPDDADGRPTGVLRWPDPAMRGARLRLGDVIALLGDQVSDVLEVPRLDPELDAGELVDALLERYAPGGTDEDSGGGGWVDVGVVLSDLERMADEALTWAQVLEPFGWRCVSGGPDDKGAHEQVWERPGKTDVLSADRYSGERSAVVYADKANLLVVYSDSSGTGFASGLRGSGRRGSAAGVGVISKWRAWVDLRWAGDMTEAKRGVRATADGFGPEPWPESSVLERLAVAWKREMDDVMEWGREREWEALMKPHTTRMDGTDP
jgi:hypothetical protein